MFYYCYLGLCQRGSTSRVGAKGVCLVTVVVPELFLPSALNLAVSWHGLFLVPCRVHLPVLSPSYPIINHNHFGLHRLVACGPSADLSLVLVFLFRTALCIYGTGVLGCKWFGLAWGLCRRVGVLCLTTSGPRVLIVGAITVRTSLITSLCIIPGSWRLTKLSTVWLVSAFWCSIVR